MGALSKLFRRQESAADRADWFRASVMPAVEGVIRQVTNDALTASRSFDAAETPAWTDTWATHGNVNINDALMRQWPTLVSRAAGLAQNNEWAQRYLIELDDNVLGPQGIRLNMHVKTCDGQRDRETGEIIENGWQDFCASHCEVSGMSWLDVETLALKTVAKRGEMLYRHRFGAGKYRYKIQMLDPVLLDPQLNLDHQGNRIRMGKEINNDGLPLAFWLLMSKTGELPSQYVSVGKHMRIPANEIQHHYLIEDPHQWRGVPWLTVGARRLWMLKDFEQAAAVASANAAKRLGFFYTPDGEAPAGIADRVISAALEAAEREGKKLTVEEIQKITHAAEKFSTTVPGQFDSLPVGTQFQPYTSDWPNVSAEGYIKQQLRAFAASVGISYVSMGNDLESVNYSSAQVGILGEREHHRKTQIRMVDWLHKPTFAQWLRFFVVIEPRLSPARYDEYLAAATWQARRWPSLDPLKQSRADEIDLRTGKTTRRRLQLLNGDDPDEIRAEWLEEQKFYGPVPGSPGTGGGDDDNPDRERDD